MSEAEGMSEREQHIERGRDYLLREAIELRKQAEAAHLEVTNLQTENAELRERVEELEDAILDIMDFLTGYCRPTTEREKLEAIEEIGSAAVSPKQEEG